MCRLLGVAGKLNPATEKIILQKFQNLAEAGRIPRGALKGHKDGWGIAAFANGKIILYDRRAEDAAQSTHYGEVVRMLEEMNHNVVVAHLRKASVGSANAENTHPFKFGNFVFAHNGTIANYQNIPVAKTTANMLAGTTDSERFFYYLMEQYQEKPGQLMEETIKACVSMVGEKLGYKSMNFVMSDGVQVWAMREVNEDDEVVKEKKLLDYYTLYRAVIDGTTVICSEKIIPGNWELIPNHKLISVKV